MKNKIILEKIKKILLISMSINILLSSSTFAYASKFDKDHKILNSESFNFSEKTVLKKEKINIDILEEDDVPIEVKENINKLKLDKNIKNIEVEKVYYKLKIPNNKNNVELFSWGKPYKGYKNMYFKDWVIRSEKSSKWEIIRNGSWKDISDDVIGNVAYAGTGLLLGALKSKVGLAFTIFDLVKSFLPKSVSSSTKVKFEAKIHVKEKIEKHTYVREGSTGKYEYGALTQKATYRFQKSLTIPGHRAITGYYTNYTTVETQHFRNPDKRAWNAIYNPWIERLGNVYFGGVYFGL